jgi:hypothetical protein
MGKRIARGAVAGIAAAGIAALVSGAALGGASSGGSSLSVSLTVSPEEISYQGAPVIVSIRLRTGTTAKTVGVGLNLSDWPDRGVVGTALVASDRRVSGAGRMTSEFVSSCCLTVPWECLRGPEADGGGVDLALPADSTTTLSYQLRLSGPPWQGMRPRVGAWVWTPVPSNNPRTIVPRAQRLRVAGATGVKVVLTSTGREDARDGLRLTWPGHPVTIRGTTWPRVAGANVRIGIKSTTYRGQRAHTVRRTLATVLTDATGRFKLRWVPPRSAIYRIDAAIPDPERGLLPDSSCDLAIDAR